MTNQTKYFTENYSYNARRYSRPWAAEVSLNGVKLDLDFISGAFAGEHQGGTGKGQIMIELKTNTVYAYGQKDFRGGNTEVNYFATSATGEIIELNDAAAAREYLISKN